MANNPWISHVQKYAKDHGIKYGEAMKKAKSSYKPVAKPKKQKGKGDIIDGLTDNSDKKLEFVDKNIDKALSFTNDILNNDTRIRRVEKRQDARDERRQGQIDRQNDRKDAINDKKVAKSSRKTAAISRSEQLKDAKFQKKLNKYK